MQKVGFIINKRIIVLIIGLVLINILLLPISSTRRISGTADTLNTDKEKIADCELEITVLEKSRVIGKDSKSFSFVLDGESYFKFETVNYGQTEDGLCLISQMYYDSTADAMTMCSLVYPEGLSYAVLRTDDALYYINDGADIAYSELPIA